MVLYLSGVSNFSESMNSERRCADPPHDENAAMAFSKGTSRDRLVRRGNECPSNNGDNVAIMWVSERP